LVYGYDFPIGPKYPSFLVFLVLNYIISVKFVSLISICEECKYYISKLENKGQY
jgi:hypothetical protein